MTRCKWCGDRIERVEGVWRHRPKAGSTWAFRYCSFSPERQAAPGTPPPKVEHLLDLSDMADEMRCIPGPLGPRLVAIERRADERERAMQGERMARFWIDSTPLCGWCGQEGHTGTECKAQPVEEMIR